MSTNLQYLVQFIQYRVSEIVITIPEVQSVINNSGKNKITSNGNDENPSVPIRRILHTRQTCSKCTCNRGKNKP
jgi:hypothetical protein